MNEEIKLKKYRDSIDKIDSQILKLLNKRFSYSMKIAFLKNKLNEPLLTPKREMEIIINLKKNNKGPFKIENLKSIYKTILSQSRKLAKKKLNAKKIN